MILGTCSSGARPTVILDTGLADLLSLHEPREIFEHCKDVNTLVET